MSTSKKRAGTGAKKPAGASKKPAGATPKKVARTPRKKETTTRPKRARRGVLVAGMHRSGTSLVADLLVSTGLHLGDDVSLIGPNPSQPRGHFEAIEVVALNDQLLELTGRHWLSTTAPAEKSLTELAHGKLGDQAREVIDAKFDGSGKSWLIKDPRFCLTLPFWRKVLADDFVLVACTRDPRRVADSLRKRDELPVELGAALWSAYNKTLVENSAGLDAFWVDYEDILARDAGALDGLHNFVAGSDQRKKARKIDSSVVDGGLQRSSLAPIDTAYTTSYSALKAARSGNDGQTASVIPWVDTSPWDSTVRLTGRLHRDLAQAKASHKTADAQLARAKKVEAARDAKVAELMAKLSDALAERDALEGRLQASIAAHVVTNDHLQKSMADHRETNNHLQNAVAERDETKQHLQNAIAERDEAKQHLQKSMADHRETSNHLQKSMADHRETNNHLQNAIAERDETKQHLQKSMADHRETNNHLQKSMADHKVTARDLRKATKNAKKAKASAAQLGDQLALRERDCSLLADELRAERRTVGHLSGERDRLQVELGRLGELEAAIENMKHDADGLTSEVDHLRGESGRLQAEADELRGSAHHLETLTGSRAFRFVRAYWWVGRVAKAPARKLRRGGPQHLESLES